MRRLLILPLAELDLKEAYQWYELNKPGLGTHFLEAVNNKIKVIRLNPDQFPKRYKHIRVAIVSDYPFIIHFFEKDNDLIILSVYHTKRNPKDLIKRTGK